MESGDKRQNELLGRLVSQLTDFAVVLADQEGRFTSWHPGVSALFGYTAEEFAGRSMELLSTAAEIDHELQTAREAGRFTGTRWLKKRDGSRILTHIVTMCLHDAAGGVAGYGRIFRDVTALKNAEDRARALAEALDQSGVLIRRFDGTIEHWTAGCERIYGWTAAEAVGRLSHELLKSRFAEPLEKIREKLLAAGSWHGEQQQTRKDGHDVLVSSQWILLPHEAGEQPRVISTHTDISSRLGMQREVESANDRLRRMADELERSNEELEEFARIASHDLSAPITTARWLIDLLASRHSHQLDEDGMKCVRQVGSSLERMSDLIEAVLAHALVGKNPINSPEECDANAALSAAIENLRGDIATSGTVIERKTLPRLPMQPQPLTQLFQNLLSNAIKYRRPGVPPQVSITAEREADFWVVCVRDNGLGIEPEWFDRIFLPLQRRQGTRVKGSGIGLATCKKIVTRAGGEMWVESEIGSGSTFCFTLPAALPSSPF